MTLQAIETFGELEEGDIQLLSELEGASERYEWIPSDRLSIISEMPQQDIEYRLDRLGKFELVKRGTPKYSGYKVMPAGYDTLALWDLVNEDVIEAFGNALGVGKEADIYDALTPEGKRTALKFNRLGLTFTSVKEVRPYELKHGWIDASKSAAKREFHALKELHRTVEVPRPVSYNRHVLVMGLIEGEELADVADIDLPELVLDEIFRNVREAYRAGIIHSDLSEHNVLIKPNGEVLIIDWPQWEPKNHPEADDLLKRDVENVLKFFRRKFQIESDLEEILNRIKSQSKLRGTKLGAEKDRGLS